MEPTPITHPITTSRPSIKRMPPELLGMIFSRLGKEDLMNTRLTCRTLSEVADGHVFRDVVFKFHLRPADGHWLQHFSNRPSISEHVRDLHFIAICLAPFPSYACYSSIMNVSALYQLPRLPTCHLDGSRPFHLPVSTSSLASSSPSPFLIPSMKNASTEIHPVQQSFRP